MSTRCLPLGPEYRWHHGPLVLWLEDPTLPSSLSWKLKMYFPAILWSVSASWLGIAAWLWNARRDCTEGFRKIISYYYIFMPVVISSVVFSMATYLDPALDAKFYSTAFALGLILGSLGKDLATHPSRFKKEGKAVRPFLLKTLSS